MERIAADPEERNSLMSTVGRTGWLVPIGLFLVLASNVAALSMPFLDIDVIIKGRMQYRLPESVWLMWTKGLYWVAILIVVFSIIFPIAKTLALIVTWFVRLRVDRRKRFIHLLEMLGKWSMLDIFVVVLLMVLSNKQIFLSTIPRVGLVFFIFAIIGNMIMSRIVEVVDERVHPGYGRTDDDGPAFMPLDSTGGPGWAVPLLAVAALGSIAVAVEIPFLRINDVLLHSNAYSVMDGIAALWEEERFVLALFLATFVATLPTIRMLMVLRLWFSSTTRGIHLRRLDAIRIVGEWSMMSVFLLALVMMATEGGQMVRTQIRGGMYAVMVSTVLCYLTVFVVSRLLRSRLRAD